MPRKHREYEFTCDCGAYEFPHRIFGGRCQGHKVVADLYDENCFGTSGECRDCVLNDHGMCQVLDGIENAKNAPCLIEFVRYEGIRPPVAWRDSLTHFKR